MIVEEEIPLWCLFFSCSNAKFHIYGGTKFVKNLITNGGENLGKPHKY